MKQNIINFLRTIFPFLLTIALWRLSGPWWNPGGILAIIPIFYCTFVRPVPWFLPFGILICFLIDYKFATLSYWTMMYCLFYAINGFQTLVDITRMDRDGIVAFSAFFGTAVIILCLMNFGFSNIGRTIWIFLWTAGLYIPTTTLIKRAGHD